MKTALVLGVTGVSGRAVVEYLETLDDWRIIGVSRNKPDYPTRATHVAADLLDPASCREKLGGLKDVTHVFYCAYVDRPTWVEQVAPNTAMLVNAVDVLSETARDLEHVCLLQGTKYYGQHLGPFKNPAREDDPRAFPPNFYYNQQDYVMAKSAGASWSWSCARPHVICGIALGNPLNIISVVAVWATLSKELGLPLRWPGKPGAFTSIYQATDAELLAKAMVWMATTPACADQAFNITNGDFVRWTNMWPKFAEYFGLELAPMQTIDLAMFMSDKEPLWNEIVKKYNLAPNPFWRVADWKFANYGLGCDWDIMSSTYKSRAFGFLEFVDTEAMFLRLFDRLRQERIIP